MEKYELYSEIQSELSEFPLQRVIQFVRGVKLISQRMCPIKTGRLRGSWFEEVVEQDDGIIEIRFGYNTKNNPIAGNSDNINYAMPVDYLTGGVRQMGFFSGAVKLMYATMRTKTAGEIQEQDVDVRGINTDEKITLPGRRG